MEQLVRRIGQTVLGPSSLDEARIAHAFVRSGPRVMVDVGAHFGESLLPYAQRHWEVHAFEPDSANHAQLAQLAASWRHVRINAEAIGAVDGQEVPLFTSAVSTGISTLHPFHASHQATQVVLTTRLDSYIHANRINEVGFLKVDAEGHDFSVLQTFPWDEIHPTAVLCEFEDRKTLALGYTYKDMAEFLLGHGYAVVISEWHPVVEYGGQHRWRRAFLFPGDVEAESWGNLLAVRPNDAVKAVRALRMGARRLVVRRLVDRVRRSG